MYSPDSVPPSLKSEYESVYIDGINATYRQFAENFSEEETQIIRAQYYGCVTHLDYHIGRILDNLEELGLKENTVVIYLSDHGEYLGDHSIWGKGSCFYDSVVRIPFIVRWPELTEPETVSEQYISLLDFFPTLIDMIDPGYDRSKLPGLSLVEHMKDCSSSLNRDFIFGELYETKYMILSPDWKYNYYIPGAYEELYDRRNDVNEMHNLANDPDYSKTKKFLRESLLDWMRSENISAALENNSFRKKNMPPPSKGRMIQPPVWQKNELVKNH
jgi:arylsulfatase A-like enzyme